MLWMSLLLACTDDFKNMDQNIAPLDTSELNSDDTGPDTGDIEDTIDTADTTETDEPVDDLDGDGWPDIAVTGDFGTSALFWHGSGGCPHGCVSSLLRLFSLLHCDCASVRTLV